MTDHGRGFGRVPGLDGVRYLAASLIVLHHAGFASNATFSSDLGPYLARMDVGVAIFFVLSGFLLYHPIVARQLADRTATRPTVYYAKRATRIYPAYWAALWLTLLLGGSVVGDGWGFVHTSLLTHVYVPIRALSGLQQSWSLAAEVAFYLVLPVLGAMSWRWARSAPPHLRPFRLLTFAGAVYASSAVFRFGAEHLAPDRFQGVMPLWMPAQVDHFAIGMALAVLAVWADQRADLRRWLRQAFAPAERWWIVAAAAMWFTSTQLDLARGLARAGFGAELLRQGLYGVIAFAVVAPLALCPDVVSPLRRALDARPMVWLGQISYGLYLWHLWIISRLPGWRDYPMFTGHFVELALAGLVLGTAAAAASHLLLERPLNDLVRRRLVRSNPLGTTEVAV